MSKFFEELQALDEPTKTKILVISTIIIMAIVIYFWLGYFNSVISGAQTAPMADVSNGQQTTGNQRATSTPAPTVFQSITNGFAAVVQSFEGIFRQPKKYEINPQ
ncbi:MAG: hypothetical protein KGJ13_06215 [Patescibacteria group bacterium]|nr:hypothetical protein [Patescibacteria group bacterium]